MKKNAKKKKGFTLVELIAVIAILGILAAVVVPKVTSYTTQATNAATKANAATIMNAIAVYNTQATAQIDTTSNALTMEDITSGYADHAKSKALDSTIKDDLIATITKVTGTSKSGISSGATVSAVATSATQN